MDASSDAQSQAIDARLTEMDGHRINLGAEANVVAEPVSWTGAGRGRRLVEVDGAVETRGRRGTFVTTPPNDPAHAARLAAQAYAQRCQEIGIDRHHALALVQAALEQAPEAPDRVDAVSRQ